MTTFEQIEWIVCNGENVSPNTLKMTCKQRDRELCFTRQCIFYMMRKYTKVSLASIGRLYGKDHSTVLHAEKVINNLIDTDRDIALKIRLYSAKIEMSLIHDYNNLLKDIDECKKHLNDCINKNFPIDELLIQGYNKLLGLK